jgi:hypothetical protein
MLAKVINRLGEWNPQLFRELKGKFTLRNLIITLSIDFMLICGIFMFGSRIHCLEYSNARNICLNYDLEIYWKGIFGFLSWTIPYILLVAGVYQISSDLNKEEQKGTLNFIRLTPQSSHDILLGKLLGVPSLIYLGLGVLIPIHFVAGIFSNFSAVWLLGIYTLWAAFSSLLYSATLLYSLVVANENQNLMTIQSFSGVAAVVTLMLCSPLVTIINLSHEWYEGSYSQFLNWYWFIFPLGSNALLGYCWLFITVAVGSYWFWEAAKRRFNNPNKTLLSKGQSYGLVASFQIWLLGFFATPLASDDNFTFGLMFVYFLIPIYFLLVIAAISPHRQTIIDWSRYRHQMQLENRNIWHDLIWGEKSPSTLALGINLLITLAIWLVWLLLTPKGFFADSELSFVQAVLALFLTVNVVLIYGIITQITLTFFPKASGILTGIILMSIMFTPLGMAGMMSTQRLQIPILFTLSPWPILMFINGSILMACLGLLGQVLIIGGLTLALKKQVTKLGRSETKRLFSERIPTANVTG